MGYGSDKSSIGEELRGRTSRLNSNESKMARSRSSDVRAGKFLNKLRGQKFSGLRPEEFAPSTKELNESTFFTAYMVLLKDRRLSDCEHDARCDLLSYMQTKMDSYQWKIIRQYHDQVIKNWERGLFAYSDDLDSIKRHYFDGHPTKMKKSSYNCILAATSPHAFKTPKTSLFGQVSFKKNKLLRNYKLIYVLFSMIRRPFEF